jgi:hypothetical protein
MSKERLPSLSKYSVEELLELNSLVCKEIAVRYASLDNELSAMKAGVGGGGHNTSTMAIATSTVLPSLPTLSSLVKTSAPKGGAAVSFASGQITKTHPPLSTLKDTPAKFVAKVYIMKSLFGLHHFQYSRA